LVGEVADGHAAVRRPVVVGFGGLRLKDGDLLFGCLPTRRLDRGTLLGSLAGFDLCRPLAKRLGVGGDLLDRRRRGGVPARTTDGRDDLVEHPALEADDLLLDFLVLDPRGLPLPQNAVEARLGDVPHLLVAAKGGSYLPPFLVIRNGTEHVACGVEGQRAGQARSLHAEAIPNAGDLQVELSVVEDLKISAGAPILVARVGGSTVVHGRSPVWAG